MNMIATARKILLKNLIRYFPNLGLLLFILLIWEILVQVGIINRDILPPPSILVITAWEMARSGLLFTNLFGSLFRVLAGFSLAVIGGVSLGLLLANFQKIGGPLIWLLELIRPIPPIAWIPIAILWFGLGNTSSIFIVMIGAIFPILQSTYSGVLNVNQTFLNVARSFGAKNFLLIFDVLLPAALPQIFSGLRIGVGIAWTSVIASELVGAHEGLGYAIQLNRILLQTEAVLVNMIVIGLTGWAMSRVVTLLEGRLIKWDLTTVAANLNESRNTNGR